MNAHQLRVIEHNNGTCEVLTHTPLGDVAVARHLKCSRAAILAAFKGWSPPAREPNATKRRKAEIRRRLVEAGLL
jgi:hypothetical protein